jgi:CDP-diacylglycerol---glycerol-3-phosphate 3-phosphatidyltransferase
MSQFTLPTLVTSLRLLAVPLVITGLSSDLWSDWLTLSFFLAAAWTDWLDGYLARRLNQETELGKFLDPLVDKLLVLGPMMSLVAIGKLPAWGVFIIVARDLVISGWRVSQATVSGANQWGKWKTVVQLSAIAGMLVPVEWVIGQGEVSFFILLNQMGKILFWISLPLTLISALVYLWPNLTGRVQGQSQAEE